MSTERLFMQDAYLKTATAQTVAVHERGIELDRTIFYPLGGGQCGDSGVLLRANGERISITDTRKGDSIDQVLHIPAPGMPSPAPGETHVKNIAEIGGIRVLRIRSEGKHNKRVEVALAA